MQPEWFHRNMDQTTTYSDYDSNAELLNRSDVLGTGSVKQEFHQNEESELCSINLFGCTEYFVFCTFVSKILMTGSL